ncbi:MAG: hypothetical protein ACFB16_16370 [Phormidesmis sp.]
MGRTRNILDLGLAIGAIAGSVAVLSPQTLWGNRDLESMTSAQAVGTAVELSVQESSIQTEKTLPLAQFLGIGQFIKTPTDYSVVVGDKTAKVTDASLAGDRMVIEYSYTASNKTKTGKLTGTVNGDGIFSGVYQAPAIKGIDKANATFTFEADGTAKEKGNSENATRIVL